MRKSTDWNWGLNEKSREARRVWPDLGVYAVVSPSPVAGRWDWHIYPQTGGHGPVRGGWARGSDAAKREATQTVNDLIAPAKRKNPSIGMPGMPHTWVTRGGVHVSGGDTIEYWSGRADLGQRRRKRGAVNRLLVFDDHVMVNDGWAGAYVGDDNFIRVVKRASRSNPDGATVPIRIYYRGDSRGVVARIPARFFKRTAGGSSLAGPNERERDRWVDRHYPGNVGWEQISEATYEVSDRVGRRNPSDDSITRTTDGRWKIHFFSREGAGGTSTYATKAEALLALNTLRKQFTQDRAVSSRSARKRHGDGISREWRWA